MKIDIRKVGTLYIMAVGLAACSSTPSVTLPMSGSWQWINTNTSYARSFVQDQATCSSEADSIQARMSQCSAAPPSDCDQLTDNVAKAMCQYSNSTTKSMCSVGRMAIPKQEIVDGCIAARGWKQEWAKASS
jgi:hypothetical protein